jgi:hypothetical protein
MLSVDVMVTERADPIVSPGKVASHVHSGKYTDSAFRELLAG